MEARPHVPEEPIGPIVMPEPSNTPSKEQHPVPLRTLATEHTGVLTPQDTVKTAGDRMRAQHAATWPVAEDRKLVGSVDEPNPDWQMGGKGHDPETWLVGSIMSRNLVFCYEDEDCARAEALMEEHGLTCLPVVDRQMRIVGIFTREEVHQRSAPQAE